MIHPSPQRFWAKTITLKQDFVETCWSKLQPWQMLQLQFAAETKTFPQNCAFSFINFYLLTKKKQIVVSTAVSTIQVNFLMFILTCFVVVNIFHNQKKVEILLFRFFSSTWRNTVFHFLMGKLGTRSAYSSPETKLIGYKLWNFLYAMVQTRAF